MGPSNKKTHGRAKKAATTPPCTAEIASPLSASSTAPTTRVAFREFIELADLESIKLFLTAAAATPDGENLKLLWARAFKEGFLMGQGSSADTLEEKLEEARNQGFKEGSSSKVDLFEAGYDEGRRDEQGDWIIEGHGQHCGFQPTTVREDSSIQTDEPPPHVDAKPLPQTLCSTPNTANSAVQTTLLSIQDASSQTLPHPSLIPDSVHATSAPPSSINWADDAASLPISPSCPPPRDLSVLRSSSPKPFSSLQRRNKWSQAHFSEPFCNHKPFRPIHRQTFSRRHFRPSRFSSTSFWPSQYPSRGPQFASTSALNWEDDPRLLELSRALNALGWVRP
ncbi:hypothetical protein M413DRAFT_32457 [Hebeloma cylindrosporum]|uniref:Uncharacterized protein n=1 Tax=Hebeloma cylindrosporum TaxID=76867 RepID=A0A0C3BFF6_HEBCY|nr:hypothetical protein M413DRAFT_32457 [Hebeloma cylindrosporum h7]